MVGIVVHGVEAPLHCLMMTDNNLSKTVLLQVGEKSCLVKKMREVSEVLHAAGMGVELDQSGALTGYPTINHEKLWLQVISWSDYLEGHEDVKSMDFEATGAHLT